MSRNCCIFFFWSLELFFSELITSKLILYFSRILIYSCANFGCHMCFACFSGGLHLLAWPEIIGCHLRQRSGAAVIFGLFLIDQRGRQCRSSYFNMRHRFSHLQRYHASCAESTPNSSIQVSEFMHTYTRSTIYPLTPYDDRPYLWNWLHSNFGGWYLVVWYFG